MDSSLKEMFEADSTRMLLLYRLPPDAVVKATRPDWGRIVRNVPEYHNMAAGNKKKKKSGGTNQNEGRPRTQPPPRGRFNADIDNYEDGPVSHPGRQAAVLKDCDSEFAKAKKVRVYSLPTHIAPESFASMRARYDTMGVVSQGLVSLKQQLKESEQEWETEASKPRPQSSLEHLPAVALRRQQRAQRRKETGQGEELRSKSESSLLPVGA